MYLEKHLLRAEDSWNGEATGVSMLRPPGFGSGLGPWRVSLAYGISELTGRGICKKK